VGSSEVLRSRAPPGAPEHLAVGARLAPDAVEDGRDPEYVWIQVKRGVYEDLERLRREWGFDNLNDVVALALMFMGVG